MNLLEYAFLVHCSLEQRAILLSRIRLVLHRCIQHLDVCLAVHQI